MTAILDDVTARKKQPELSALYAGDAGGSGDQDWRP
jgi:hypothetical protein